MKNIAKQVFSKAEEVLFLDKIKTKGQLSDIVSSEIYYVLKQYFEISPQNYKINIHVDRDGSCMVSLNFLADRILIKKEGNLKV